MVFDDEARKKAVDLLEDMDIPQEKIDEFLANLPKTKEEDSKRVKELERQGYHVQTLKEQMVNEKDWRVRASIAARIISQGLE